MTKHITRHIVSRSLNVSTVSQFWCDILFYRVALSDHECFLYSKKMSEWSGFILLLTWIIYDNKTTSSNHWLPRKHTLKSSLVIRLKNGLPTKFVVHVCQLYTNGQRDKNVIWKWESRWSGASQKIIMLIATFCMVNTKDFKSCKTKHMRQVIYSRYPISSKTWWPLWWSTYSVFLGLFSRSGVEDSRLEAKAKDTKKIRGQGQPFRKQTLLRPTTGMLEAKAKDQGHKHKCSPKKKVFKNSFWGDLKKNVFTKIFQAISRKKRLPKNFQALHKILTIQKIVLSSSLGQANFRGLEASRPRPRTWPSRPIPRTSKCVLEYVLEANDVLKDSTSVA